MIMSSFDEYRKKMNGKYGVKEEEKEKEEEKGEKEENKPSPSSDSGSDSSSKFESYRSKMESKYNHAKDVDEKYIESFLRDAKKFVNDAVSVNTRMGYSTSTNLYNDRKKTADDLRSRVWNISQYLQQNKGNIPDEYYKSLSDYLDNFGKYTSQSMHSMYRSDQFYSQWETAEDYNFWESRNTVEKRQNLYAEQEQRLEELKAEKEALRKQVYPTTVSYPGYGASSNVGYTGYGASSKIHEAASQENIKKLGAIDDEIASIEMEMANYKRGNYNDRGQHYGSKVVDDYSAYTKESDFDTKSANRAFANPTKDELINYDVMSDSSTWYFDADGTYRDAFGNELKVDESGNWVNPAAGSYPIADRLGMFLSASEDDKVEASATTAGTEGVWANVLKDGIDGDWDQLEKGEISIYYYLLNSQGQQAADKYLSDMKTELNRRGMEKYISNLSKAFDEANTLERIALSLATTPAQFVSGAAGFLDDAINRIAGNDINPYSAAHGGTAFSTTVRSKQAQAWDEATGGIAIPFIDFSVGDLYQAGMSALDMLAGRRLGPRAYEALMGMGSASSEAKRLYEQGATTEQIAWGAGLAGGAEMVFEHLSIESLIKLKDAKTVGQFVKNALIQGGIEATEEGFTEIANTITNAIVMGDESDWAKLLEKHDGDYLGALIEKAQEVGNAAFSGFVSGSMGGAAHSAPSFVSNKLQMRSDGKTIKSAYGGVDSLQQLAKEVAAKSSEDMQKTIQKQSDKLAKKATAGRAGLLYDTVKNANNLANASANQADIAKSLERKGFNSETANDIAEALVAQYNGQELTEVQSKLLESVEHNTYVRDAISNIMDNVKSTMGQRSQNIRDFGKGIYRSNIAKAMQETAKKNFTPEGEYEVSETSKAVRTDTNEEIDIKGVASVSKGKLMLELADGQTIDAKSVSFANEADALIYEAVARLGDNIDDKAANKLISKFNGGNAMVFARGMAQAYTWGFYGFDKAELSSESALTSELTPEQINTAYGLGEKYRTVKDAKDRDKARSTKAPAEKGVYYRDKDGNATDIETYMKENGKNLNARHKTAIEVMRKFSNMMGARFHVFESWVKNGKNYYLDENGKVVEGNPNGFYDTTTGEIYIALDAGAIEANGFRDTMLFTIAHEMTHFMRQWSPEHFTKISKIIFQQAGFKGHMSELVAAKQAKAKAKGKPISYDTAVEEVVADGMETILKDGKVVEFMAEVKQKDHGAWQKLKGWFKNLEKFLRKLVTAYRYETANTIEGDMVANFADDLIRQIQQIWAEGAVAAGDNYQAVDGYKADQEQMSTDTMRGSADGAVVQSEVTEAIVESKQQIRTEFEALPKQMMNLSDGAGTILDFIEGLNPTKVKGLSGKSINGYTGRDVRAYAMGISGFTQAQVNRVNKFMDTMAEFMEEAGVTYKFIGLQDVHDAKLHYTYNADGSIKSIVLSAMVKNGDYPVNFDLSSICKKRVAMSKLIDKLAKRGSLDNGTVKLTPANIFKINTALKDEGYETACLGCFVESKRYNSLEWAKTFCNKWNAAVKKVNPNATYFGYGDASFNEDSFTLEQATKIDDAANKYIKTTKTERMANALANYKAREQAGLPLVVRNYKGKEYHDFSKAAKKRLVESDTISDELKEKYIDCDTTTLNMADVEFLLENGILPGAALSNKQAVTEMVKSGEAYQHLLRPSDLLTDRGISKLEALPNFHGVLYGHYGSGTPKLMQSYTPYNSEIALLPAKKGDLSLAEYLYSIAGVRMQSFSDFQIQNIYDYLQMVGDLAARKVPAHAYTKELPFAKLLGMTGIKVNLSVMFDIDPMVDKAHAGLTKLNKLVHRGEYAKVVLEDAQGKWVYNIGDYQTQKLFAEAYPDQAKRFLQSIGFGDAVKLQSSPGYSANCGIIGVGYSDLGIFAMLNDNRIRYIIPYHASSLPAEIKLATNIALGTDYTPYQNNMKIKEIVDRNGNKVNWTIKEAYKRLGSGQAVINELNEKIRTEGWVVSTSKAQTGHGSYGLYEDLQQTNDPRQTASNFMDWCIGNSTLPLFYQFASHENYYKLLYDYNVYDCVTEEYAPQQAVTNTYPTMVDGQVQPGNVTDGGFDAEYFKGAIDKQMAFMNEYSRNLDEDLDALAKNMEKGSTGPEMGILYSNRDVTSWDINWDEDNYSTIKSQMVKHMAEINRMNPVADIEFDKSKGKTYANILDEVLRTKFGYKIDRADGASFLFDKVAIATLRRYVGSDEEAAAVTAAPYVLKRGKAISGHKNHKNLGNPSVTYAGPVTINDERVNVGVVVLFGDKNRPHSLRVLMPSGNEYVLKKQETDPKRKGASPDGGVRSSTGSASEDRVTQPEKDVKKFSDRDTTYLDAVYRGDMETAQRMVDEAAKAAGYTTKAYHGTRSEFTKFDIVRSGANYDGWSQFGKGLYFSKTVSGAEHWASMANGLGKMRVMPTYLRLNNPLVISPHSKLPADVEAAMEAVDWEANWYDIAKPLGYDGIVKEGYESDDFTNAYIFQYVVFDANQIKSADPVTYDDSGNVIPLSQRFNTEKDDIRYSDRDSTGKQLSREQQEFFKDSKARDDKGRLKVLYHGTEKGGFTEFIDTDDIGYFFTDKEDVAWTYSGSYKEFAPKKISSWDEAIGLAKENGMELKPEWYIYTISQFGAEHAESDNYDSLEALHDDWEIEDGDKIRKVYVLYDGYSPTEYKEDELRSVVDDILAKQEETDVNYMVYLNIKDPLVINGNGSNWDNVINHTGTMVTYDELTDEQIEAIADEMGMDVEDITDITDNSGNSLAVFDVDNNWINYPQSTREWVIEAKDMGCDGVIFKDIDDSGKFGRGYGAESTVYVVMDSNQIKSVENKKPTSNPDIRYSERVSNKELAGMDETALYIKNTDKANYIGMIFNGTKTEETRTRRTLDAFIGKDFYVTDGKRVYGSIVLGEPHKYTEAEFHKKENRLKHRVPIGDEYDIKPGGIKWAYPIESYKKFDKPKKLSDSTEYKNSFQARQVLYSDRDYGKVVEQAVKQFGTTTDFAEAGFILPNGKMLKFTDEKHRGERAYDHRAIGLVYGVDVDLSVNHGFNQESNRHLDDFVEGGSIRFFPGDLDNDMDAGLQISGSKPLTREQEQTIRDFIEWKKHREEGYKPSEDDFSLYSGPLALHIDFGAGANSSGFANKRSSHGLTYEGGQINASRIISDIRHYYQTGETRKPSLVAQFRYSDRDTESVSNRSLLANAFEGIAKPEEQKKVQEYKDKIALINAEEQKLRELNQQIKELSFAKGPKDTKKLKALRFDANQAANRINTYDKQLLRLEASQPLQDVLAREKKRAYAKAAQRGREALAEYKAKAKAQQKETVDKWRESRKTAVAKARETADKRDARAKLQKLVLDTVKWISYPAKTDVKCPDILKKPYKDFLDGIDLSSERLANGGDPTKNDLRLANAMDSLATALDRVMTAQDPNQEVDKVLDIGYLDLPANFVAQLRDMTEAIKAMMVEGDYVVNTMTAAEVRKLSQMIRTLNHAIKTMSKLYANLRFANVEALGFDTMDFLDALGEIEKTGGVKDFVQWDNSLPYYAFKRFGKGGESVFEGLMDAQDKLAFLAQEIFNFQEKTWTSKEAKEWSEDTHTIDLPNENKLTLTTADAMSVYCLSRRQQGIQHLLGGGVRVIGIQKGSTKAKDSRSLLTIEDVDAIISSLTDRQKQVAEGIQEFMSTVCSEWGNEISMKRFLTKEFTEKFYFPIESNDENLTAKDPAAQQSDLFRLLNISATKPLTQGANNEVIVRNIFDVFTGHASDMARLNAYGMGLLDYMKWLNYREKVVNEAGQINVKGVRKYMEKAYGKAANSYVLNLIKDVNGRASDGGDPNIFMKWMRSAKTASVGNSLRVATLQITSYPRAALVLSPKSLAFGLSKKPNIKKAKKYCGIALWKSFGFYDTNISRSIEDQMKGVTNVKQKLIELSLKGAEWGDAITWGALWNACEYEVAAEKKFEVGTEEFNQAVAKKLREVVYRTQVVDSALTRSQIMRSKRGMAQEATAFMSEPTLSANILMDAGFEFSLEKRRTGSAKAAWKKTGSYIGRAVAVYSIGQLAAALMEGLWDAWRDDEDEEFGEKFLRAFGENLALDLVPFNKIPIISDAFEAALALFDVGYFSSDKMSTAWLTQAVSAADAWREVLGGSSSATVYNALYKTVRSVSSFYGFSFSGVMREGVALWNNTAGSYDATLKVLTYDRSNAELGGLLLDAILEGDDRQADSLRAEFEDEDASQSALRSTIKERYEAGDIDSETAMSYLTEYAGMEDSDAYWKVEEWEYESESGEDFGKYDEFFTAVETGKNLRNVIKQYTDNGVKPDTLATQITSHFKPIYGEMTASQRAKLKGYLLNAFELCGMDREKASDKITEWQFETDHPELVDRITFTQYKKWETNGKPNGVSVELFAEVAEFRDEDGSSKSQEKVADYINSLPISTSQKDALWCCFWKESTLDKAPWH